MVDEVLGVPRAASAHMGSGLGFCCALDVTSVVGSRVDIVSSVKMTTLLLLFQIVSNVSNSVMSLLFMMAAGGILSWSVDPRGLIPEVKSNYHKYYILTAHSLHKCTHICHNYANLVCRYVFLFQDKTTSIKVLYLYLSLPCLNLNNLLCTLV